MKPYLIVKSFHGSQDGLTTDSFVAGSTVELSDDLAAIVLKEGWVEPVATDPVLEPEPEPESAPQEEDEDDTATAVEERETKVDGPEETKPVKPTGRKKATAK